MHTSTTTPIPVSTRTPIPTLDGAPMPPDLAAHIEACHRRYAAARGCLPCAGSAWYAGQPHARHCPHYVDPRVPAMVAELVRLEASREALS